MCITRAYCKAWRQLRYLKIWRGGAGVGGMKEGRIKRRGRERGRQAGKKEGKKKDKEE